MIRVHTTGKSIREFPEGARFANEQDFNNLCVWDAREALLIVFAEGQWVSAEVVADA